MRENGTDRDVALLILDGLTTCANLVATVNDNLYVPHITTQPTDQVGAIGDTVIFTVVANNAVAYQWQYKVLNWHNASGGITNQASYSIQVSTERMGYQFRCRITGKDGSYIYSDAVKMVAPEAEG